MSLEADIEDVVLADDLSSRGPSQQGTMFAVLAAISFSHLLNDLIQSLIPAIYPLLKDTYKLDFGQIGLISFTYQLTASLLQPIIGTYTDRSPKSYSLAAGMGFTLVGLVMLSSAGSFPMLLVSSALIGVGSSVFHPESSRVARMASGGRHGFAQSFFQVGGNVGSALGPLLAALIIIPHGQGSLIWFSVVALVAIVVLFKVGGWYKRNRVTEMRTRARHQDGGAPLTRGKVGWSLAVLLGLVFSKYFYLASISSYYTFYLIEKFGVSVQSAQIHLFIFMAAVAAGVILGGPIGDRFGRKFVIWYSILGVLPFTLALPYMNYFWTAVLSVPIGLILSSAFPAIVVYAQELVPGRVGMVSGLFFGFAFGMAGIGAAALGELADQTSIAFVYRVCAFLPLLGLMSAFLPDLAGAKRIRQS